MSFAEEVAGNESGTFEHRLFPIDSIKMEDCMKQDGNVPYEIERVQHHDR